MSVNHKTRDSYTMAFKMERPKHRRVLVDAVRERENRDLCAAAKRGEMDDAR